MCMNLSEIVTTQPITAIIPINIIIPILVRKCNNMFNNKRIMYIRVIIIIPIVSYINFDMILNDITTIVTLISLLIALLFFLLNSQRFFCITNINIINVMTLI